MKKTKTESKYPVGTRLKARLSGRVYEVVALPSRDRNYWECREFFTDGRENPVKIGVIEFDMDRMTLVEEPGD